MPKTVRIKRRKFLIPLIIVFSFILPFLFLILGVVIFRVSNRLTQSLEEEKFKIEEKLTPSQVLKNKSKYHQQKILLRGRVNLSPIVCEKKECTIEDSCCGCPDKRDLYLYDAGSILKGSGEEKLKMINIFTGQSLCQRKISSCEYDCGDWNEGAIYDVYGRFFAEPVPSGWQKSLNYYLEVEGKELIKQVNFSENFGNFINEIKERFQGWKTSGQYVLP
jgi:hypothetical protein